MPSNKKYKDFIEWIIPTSILDEAVQWISVNMNPDDVFSTSDLNDWALNNGFIYSEDE